jgi:hypothetical protein
MDDLIPLGPHGSSTCSGIVNATSRSTWGRLKTHYR